MRSLRKILSLALTLSLLFQQIGFAQIAAELNISGHLSKMASSFAIDKFRPLHLRYFSYDLNSNNFKFLFDKGDFEKGLSPKLVPEGEGTVPEEKFKEETQTLLKYFLIGITLPDSKFWVNLRPDSSDRIIEPELEQTDLGRVLLEADLQLKKDTAQYTSPETPEGREYWNKLYKKAEELFGYENITIPTLTRPWIVPGEIIVRETQESAFIYKSTLKVMLEEDYLKKTENRGQITDYTFKDIRSKALNEYSTQLIKELIIPKLTKEVNTSKKYANLRQAFYSLILSRWFKARYASKKGLSPKLVPEGEGTVPFYVNLINSGNLNGLTSKEPWSKTTYFEQYQKSFTDGEYNIKEPVYTPTGQVIRSYFSGGFAMIDPATVYSGVGAKAIGDEKFLTSNKNFMAVTFAKTGPSDGAVLAPIIPLQGEIEKVQKPSSSSPITIEALKRGLITKGLNLELTNKLLKAVTEPLPLSDQNAFYVFDNEGHRVKIISLEVLESTPTWGYHRITFNGERGEYLCINVPMFGNMDRIKIDTNRINEDALVYDIADNIMKVLNSAAGSPLTVEKVIVSQDLAEKITPAFKEQIERVLKERVGPVIKSRIEGETGWNPLNYRHNEIRIGEYNGREVNAGVTFLIDGGWPEIPDRLTVFISYDDAYTGEFMGEADLYFSTAAGPPITGEELITAIENALLTYPKDRQSAYDSLNRVENLPEMQDRVAAKMKELTNLYGSVGIVLENLKEKISPEQSFISVEDFLQKQALDNLLDGVDGERVLAMVADLLKREPDVLKIKLSGENKLSSSAVTKNDITEKEKQVAKARRQAYNTNQTELDRAYALGRLSKLNRELADLQKKKRSGSSPMTPDGINTKKDVGGIDFRVMNIITQPLVASSTLNLKLPQSANLARINLDEELKQMKNMLAARITPSGERFKEVMASSALKGEWDKRIPEIISYLVDVCRLEEDNLSETPIGIREALIIADSANIGG